MRSAQARDGMVTLVQEAFADFPAFVSLPESKSRSVAYRVTVANPLDGASYVAALHEFCAAGLKPTARRGNDLVA